jgi:hypothetical protein
MRALLAGVFLASTHGASLRAQVMAIGTTDSLAFVGPAASVAVAWQPGVLHAWCVTRHVRSGGILIVIEVAAAPRPREVPPLVPLCADAQRALQPIYLQDATCEMDDVDRALFDTVARPWVLKQCAPTRFGLRREGPVAGKSA